MHAQSRPGLLSGSLMDCSSPGSSVHGISPGENTGVSCHSLLQEILLTQGLNPCLLHWQDSLSPGHLGSLGVVWAMVISVVFDWNRAVLI